MGISCHHVSRTLSPATTRCRWLLPAIMKITAATAAQYEDRPLTHSVFDIRTGEVHGRHLSHEAAAKLLLDIGVDHDAEAEQRCDDPGSDLLILRARARPHLAGVDDDRFDAIAQTAASIGWKAAVEQLHVRPFDGSP
jgi:hypothetical protein